jgi:hypothetical protein
VNRRKKRCGPSVDGPFSLLYRKEKEETGKGVYYVKLSEISEKPCGGLSAERVAKP